MKSLSCPNRRCSRSRKSAAGSIIRHGFYKTRLGKRRRYQCQICGRTFGSTTGTCPYQKLHKASEQSCMTTRWKAKVKLLSLVRR